VRDLISIFESTSIDNVPSWVFQNDSPIYSKKNRQIIIRCEREEYNILDNDQTKKINHLKANKKYMEKIKKRRFLSSQK